MTNQVFVFFLEISDENTERSKSHILNESLHDLVLVWHMCHHMGHVVLGGANQSGTKHDGQVPRFHLTHNKINVYWMVAHVQ